MSMSKSTPKSVSFYGDNTHGPYSLKAFQILQNSEVVRINGQTIIPSEYTMDYFSGQILTSGPIIDIFTLKSQYIILIDELGIIDNT